jgi:hypothetical protein
LLVLRFQNRVRHALSKSELRTELGAPEGSPVTVDGIVGDAADVPIGGDVLVSLEFTSDGLVELRRQCCTGSFEDLTYLDGQGVECRSRGP